MTGISLYGTTLLSIGSKSMRSFQRANNRIQTKMPRQNNAKSSLRNGRPLCISAPKRTGSRLKNRGKMRCWEKPEQQNRNSGRKPKSNGSSRLLSIQEFRLFVRKTTTRLISIPFIESFHSFWVRKRKTGRMTPPTDAQWAAMSKVLQSMIQRSDTGM